MAKNAVPSYEQKFFTHSEIGGITKNYEISGIQNISAGYDLSQNTVDVLGAGFTQSVYDGPLEGDFSFSRQYVVAVDPILEHTGDHSISGSLIYSSDLNDTSPKVFGFDSGYLTDYTVSCAVGDTPSVDCSFRTFGRFGSGIAQGDLDFSGRNTSLSTDSFNALVFANQGSITCGYSNGPEIDLNTTNRVTQVTQSYSIPRSPLYALTQKTNNNLTGGANFVPVEVLASYPIEVTTDMTIGVDDFETANIMDTIRSGNYKTIELKIQKAYEGPAALLDNSAAELLDDDSDPLKDNGYVTMYKFRSVTGHLVSEKIETAVDGSLSVNLTFKDYLQRNL
jgi:hypothetical protein